MGDDKRGRDRQARDEERRQRERELAEELKRMDEPEPPVETEPLVDLELALDAVAFPATGAEVIAEAGDHEVESADGTYAVADLLPDTDAETFRSAATVRMRVQRPTVAAAMKRIVEATDGVQGVDLTGSQREAYEKTLRALAAIEADDEDEGIEVVTDWVVEQIRAKKTLPGSRDVRRRAAKFCRANGYAVRDDDWLGV